ncbi:hypothetical protein EXU48_22240 [Occultella glacieicola]|uniref:SGNH hydrolase-type esterase domain-containing protein n=1 Tax=Occultella glacieicola TaxID=2518684 RepID=A0ABY2DYH2_9MICO|nr:GDSL-type esterase/lipase family protein [Occultella glacieicola]TDE88811.1 hypothetical protein EXU48_22240 [Occultella glacieicola]
MTAEDVRVTPSMESTIWRGAVDWAAEDGLWQPWRLLPAQADRAHAPDLIRVARMAAGVRAQVRTDAGELVLPFEHADGEGRIDLIVDGELTRRVDVAEGVAEVRLPLPAGVHDVELWLPQSGNTRVGDLGLVGANVAEATAPRPRWTTYGSSISQCGAAFGPSETWPALVARRLGWDLTCLGFSGQCHLDPIAARTIAAVPADVISLCLGINIMGGATFGPRSFAAHISGFVEQVRAAHPDVPILVMTPIVSPPRERTPNAVGLTLELMRTAIAEVVAMLATDDPNLHLLDGTTIIGTEDVHLLPDDLHPDGEGYRLMAERIAPALVNLPRLVGVR